MAYYLVKVDDGTRDDRTVFLDLDAFLNHPSLSKAEHDLVKFNKDNTDHTDMFKLLNSTNAPELADAIAVGKYCSGYPVTLVDEIWITLV